MQYIIKKWLPVALFLVVAFSLSAADIAVTSIGQSADATMIKVLLQRESIAVDYDKLMSADDLGAQKILIAVVGGSSKGLGAAGIDKDQELARGTALLEAAGNNGIKILVMHVGGEGRRGTLSDAFINATVPYADDLIIVENGNSDGLFSDLAAENNLQLKSVTNVRDSIEPLSATIDDWLS